MTTFTRFCSAALLAGLALPALADPSAKTIEEKGSDAQLRLEWELSWVQVDGVPGAARINAALRKHAQDALAGLKEELKDWDNSFASPETSSGLWLEMGAGVVGPRFVSINASLSVYYNGAAHPNHAVESLNFDARSGAAVATRDLFAPGEGVMDKVAALVDAKLKAMEDYRYDGDYMLETVTAENIHTVVLEADGASFIFGSYEIGPYAVGIPSAKLSWAELEGLLAPGVPGVPQAAAASGFAGRVEGNGRASSLPAQVRRSGKLLVRSDGKVTLVNTRRVLLLEGVSLPLEKSGQRAWVKGTLSADGRSLSSVTITRFLPEVQKDVEGAARRVRREGQVEVRGDTAFLVNTSRTLELRSFAVTEVERAIHAGAGKRVSVYGTLTADGKALEDVEVSRWVKARR